MGLLDLRQGMFDRNHASGPHPLAAGLPRRLQHRAHPIVNQAQIALIETLRFVPLELAVRND